ncbi:MAG: M18 family aminopeptidase [Propionibacteriaceae bacterium]
MPTALALEHVHDLTAFVSASPSSFHAVAEVRTRLLGAGFVEHTETEPYDGSPGGHLVVRDGSVVAWRVPTRRRPRGLRILGAHTDSPTFTLKPRPDTGAYGWQQVGMEVYGGPLLNSWLDRELGLAGRIGLRDGRTVLVRTGPIMRIPQLAIHLDRAVNEEGVKLDRQQHTMPVWSVGRPDLAILHHLADVAGIVPDDILGTEVVAYVAQRPEIFGPQDEFLASGRLDNLSSVHAGVAALATADPSDDVQVVAAFDHEEVGSGSRSGAAGPFLDDTLRRIALSLGVDGEGWYRLLAGSICVSADAGHAVHPNYASRHDPANRPLLNGGPLLKINANQRYATDASGAAVWHNACTAAGVPTQEFVSNNAIPCGSTIGPLTATRTGIATIDVGIPLLSMHSARELAGVADPHALAAAMRAFLGGGGSPAQTA